MSENETLDEMKEDNNEESNVYCIKRLEDTENPAYQYCNGQDDGSFMICCDKCENWYHGICVNIKERESNKMDKYICIPCEQKGLGKTSYKEARRSVKSNKSRSVIQLTEEQKLKLEEQRLKIEEEKKKARELAEQERKKREEEEKKRYEEELKKKGRRTNGKKK